MTQISTLKHSGPPPTLAVEKHGESLWLVAYAAPGDQSVQLVAEFVNAASVAPWRRAWGASMGFAREVGRSGLG